MKPQKFGPHVFSLSALVTMGNAIVITPKLNFISFVFFFALSLFLMWITTVIIKRSYKNIVLYSCVEFLVCAVAISGSVITLVDYLNFLTREQMPQTNVIPILIVLIALIAFFYTRKMEVVYKYALLSFVGVVLVIVLCFIGGVKIFTYKNIADYFLFSGFSAKGFFALFSSVIVLPLIAKQNAKAVFCGVSTGFVLILIASLHTVFILGVGANVLYPYLKSVGVISSGSLFTRLDGLVYYLFFTTALLKMVIGISVIKKCNIAVKLCNCTCLKKRARMCYNDQYNSKRGESV